MPLRILMLATDAHGGFGGIAQYNRDVLDALSALDQVARVIWLSSRVPALVIAISAFTLRSFQAWSGTPDARTALVPNAIRADQYGLGPPRPDLLARHGLHGKTVILTLGRMAPDERYKGFDEVIACLPALVRQRPDLVYLAAGDGPDRPRLQALAQALGVADHVIFPGRIAEADKADYYRLADAYVMPSHGEGFGFVILEALACGLPAIASRADGTQEAVRDGALGQLVDPQDAQALQDAILQALRQPKQIPAGLDYFSFDQFTRRLAAALDRATGAAPAPAGQRPPSPGLSPSPQPSPTRGEGVRVQPLSAASPAGEGVRPKPSSAASPARGEGA